MAWRAGNKQARSALRARNAAAAAANRLPAAKALCIQWARTAPRSVVALRDAVSDDAEDADQRERHGREDAKQYFSDIQAGLQGL